MSSENNLEKATGGFRNYIKMSIREEMERLRPMSFRKRVEHLLSNYWMYLVIVIFTAVPGFILIRGLLAPAPEYYLTGTVLDYGITGPELEKFTDDFALSHGINRAEISMQTTTGVTMEAIRSGAGMQRFLGIGAQITCGDLDVIFTSEEMLLYLQSEYDMALMDLRKAFSERELDALAPYLYFLKDGNGQPYPVGIRVNSSGIWPESIQNGAPLYFGITVNSEKTEQAISYLTEILREP